MNYVYEKDGSAIYRRSFAIIRAEARLDRLSRPMKRLPCASSTPAA